MGDYTGEDPLWWNQQTHRGPCHSVKALYRGKSGRTTAGNPHVLFLFSIPRVPVLSLPKKTFITTYVTYLDTHERPKEAQLRFVWVSNKIFYIPPHCWDLRGHPYPLPRYSTEFPRHVVGLKRKCASVR